MRKILIIAASACVLGAPALATPAHHAAQTPAGDASAPSSQAPATQAPAAQTPSMQAAPASPASGSASGQTTTQATPTAPTAGVFSDAQLHAFVAASTDIAPIMQRPNAASDPQAIADMRAVLQRNNLDAATYNAIAQRARGDTSFAARLAALRTNTHTE